MAGSDHGKFLNKMLKWFSKGHFLPLNQSFRHENSRFKT